MPAAYPDDQIVRPHVICPRTTSIHLSSTLFNSVSPLAQPDWNTIRCPIARRVPRFMEGLGLGDDGYDTTGDATHEADRSETQVFVLSWAHPNVRTCFKHLIKRRLIRFDRFVNILLSKLLKEPYTEPKNFTTIFERGIDPHVDDPDHCHVRLLSPLFFHIAHGHVEPFRSPRTRRRLASLVRDHRLP